MSSLSPVFNARIAGLALLLAVATVNVPSTGWAQSSVSASEVAPTNGPIRLRQPQGDMARSDRASNASSADRDRRDKGLATERRRESEVDGEAERRETGSEFERFVRRLTNDDELRRFGADMVEVRVNEGLDAVKHSAPVPADYPISSGDELILTLWGSVDADLRLTVDRTGRIHIPRVGSVLVRGEPYSKLHALIEAQAKRTFKNFSLSVSLGQLRGVRVYVTGYVRKPGAYAVDSLTSVSAVLFALAQGPSEAGSFRNIQLRRAGQVVAQLDMYDLMIKGKGESDQLLRAGDIIHVGPVGRQVALIGSVNSPAIFELLPNETVADLLSMGGGLNSVADRTRLAVEGIDERSTHRIRQLALPLDLTQPLKAGDVVRAFSAVDAALPIARQNKRVTVEGEVLHPGEYILQPASSVLDAIRAAGGLTGNAFVFGTEFSRLSVRATQQANYERAIRDLELQLSKQATTDGTSVTVEDATTIRARRSATERLLARMRGEKPTGRIVLQLEPTTSELPNLALEDGDRILVPGRPTTVGIFGSVYNAGNYLYQASKSVGDYLLLAGNTTRGADDASVFVIRANGTVVSVRQRTDGWFGSSERELRTVQALPGDTIFVPEEVNKPTFIQAAKDWTLILSQFGLGIASIATLTK